MITELYKISDFVGNAFIHILPYLVITIPIAAMLMGGVPLAPVMAFWVAPPSMDPEIFFLSVDTLGSDLAVWRLIGTLVMGLTAGGIPLVLVKAGWIGPDIFRRKQKRL